MLRSFFDTCFFSTPAKVSLSLHLAAHKGLIRSDRFCSVRMHWPDSALVSYDTITMRRHKKILLLTVFMASAGLIYGYYAWGSRLGLRDIVTFAAGGRRVGVLAHDPV